MSRRIPFQFLAVPRADWCPDGAPLDPIERAVIGVLVSHWMRGADVMAVGAAQLRNVTGYSERAVDGARDRLLARGLLVRITAGGGRNKPATYALGALVTNGAPAAPKATEERGHRMPGNDAERGHGNGAPKGAPHARLVEEKGSEGASAAPRPSLAVSEQGRVKTWQ